MSSRLIWVFPFILLSMGGCGSLALQPGAERVAMYDVRNLPDQKPDFEYDALGPVTAKDGSGCGLFGSSGDRDTARTRLFNNTASLGGDSIILTYFEAPHMSGICFSNQYLYKGIAANRWWPHYIAPTPVTKFRQSIEIKGNYDKVWTALVDYVSASFFRIATYEKESGLLTLDFSEADISRYVDCGTWELRTWDGTLKRSEAYAKEFQDSMSLQGQMNLRVKQTSPGVISLYVNTRYDLVLQYHHNKRRTETYKWNFVTNKSATSYVINNTETREKEPRICKPTNSAENYIMNGIQAIANKKVR